MSNKLPTVTVAFSAFNEAANIKVLLESILMQKEDGFVLEKILVVSDGSVDDSVKIIRGFKNSKIDLRNHPDRKGKSVRLNEIYADLGSDILIQTDADVFFANSDVIKNMVSGLMAGEKIMMVGGNLLPVVPTTFTEKAVYVACEVYRPIRTMFRGGDNVLTVNGPILGYKKEFAKQLQVPKDMLANDMFTYVTCKYRGFKYKYVESAVVHYRLPQTLRDQVKQEARFIVAPDVIKRYLPSEIVDECISYLAE